MTREPADPVFTASPILTRTRGALVNIDVAVLAFQTVRANASVIIDEVHASGMISTRIQVALVDVNFTMGPLESRQASTLPMVHHVHARTAI